MALRGKMLAFAIVGSTLFGYEMNVQTSSRTAYMGEPVLLTYTFTRTPQDEGIDFRFAAPELAHMKVLDSRTEEVSQNGTNVWKKEYVVAPLQSGELSTGTAAMNVAERSYEKDAWGQWMPSVKWEQHRFGNATIFANPVPPNIQAVGRFAITATTDKNETDSGHPVRLILTLRGCGNLQMAEPLREDIKGVNIFEEGYTQNATWKGGCYYSESNRTFALVGTKDFTIPSVIFRTFDPQKNAVVKRQTLPIEIHINPTTEPAETKIKKEEKAMNVWSLAAGVFIGIIIGVAATFLLLHRKRSKHKVRYDSMRGALVGLFRHLDDPEAKKSAEAVEKYLYEGADVPDGVWITGVLTRLKTSKRAND